MDPRRWTLLLARASELVQPPGGAAVKILVVGAGIFGVTGALELARRGHDVTVVDPGPLPHPDASSTDLSMT